jgi:zona occludens toxin (predicted ATPase)
MRYIIVLIALLALCSLMPSIWAEKPFLVSSSENATTPSAPQEETALTTTPSIAAFLSNSWMPPSALNASVNASVNNSTITNNVVAVAGESSLQFLQDSWTPSTQVEVIPTTPFKMHELN